MAGYPAIFFMSKQINKGNFYFLKLLTSDIIDVRKEIR